MKVMLCAVPNVATGPADRGVAELAAVEVEGGIRVSGGGLVAVGMVSVSDLVWSWGLDVVCAVSSWLERRTLDA